MDNADLRLLYALHHSALEIVSEREWIGVIDEVRKAGSVLKVEGYAQIVLQKAAQRQSFGGNRSAAGAYAASVRWGKRGKGGTSDGAVATSNPAGAGETMNMEKIGETHSAAIAAVGADSPAGRELVVAQKEVKAASKADVNGDAFGAWNLASAAEFRVRPLAEARGAKGAVKRLHEMLKRLVVDYTDAFYAEAAA
jgi:hypothetical protein